MFRRADGRWCGVLEVGTALPRKRKHVYGRTQQEAVKKLRDARREYERTGNVPSVLTVGEWLRHWLEGKRQDKTVAPLTMANYEYKMGQVIAGTGRRRLDRLEAEHVRQVYRALGENHANSYVGQTHRILKRAITDAYLEGKVGRNVMELVKAPKVGRAAKVVRPMLAPEFIAMCQQIAGDRLESRWLFQPTLGLRQGEVLGLGWEDVDLDTGNVTITRALQRQPGRHGCTVPCGKTPGRCPQMSEGGLTFVKPKSDASGATLPLPPLLWESMRQRYAVWLSEDRPDLTRFGPLAPHALVWGQVSGLPRDSAKDRREWYALLAAAGVPRMGTHSGRHGLATLLSNGGEPVKVAQRILRHSNVAITLGIYTHSSDAEERRAINAAEQAWRSPGDA